MTDAKVHVGVLAMNSGLKLPKEVTVDLNDVTDIRIVTEPGNRGQHLLRVETQPAAESFAQSQLMWLNELLWILPTETLESDDTNYGSLTGLFRGCPPVQLTTLQHLWPNVLGGRTKWHDTIKYRIGSVEEPNLNPLSRFPIATLYSNLETNNLLNPFHIMQAKKNVKKAKGNAAKGGGQKRSGITPRTNVKETPMKVQWGSDRVHISGQEFLSTIEFQEPPNNRNFAGATVLMVAGNPLRFPGSRLTQFANLFQRFKFKNFVVRYVPAVPATTAGQLIMAFDTDPTWAPVGSSQEVLRAMMAHKNRQIFHVFDDKRAQLPATDKADYYCDAKGQDLRLNNQFIFWLCVMAPVVTNNGGQSGTVGSLMLEWDCEFKIPRIETPQRIDAGNVCNFLSNAYTGAGSEALLDFASGSRPTTQCFTVIFTNIQALEGIEIGVPYFAASNVCDLDDQASSYLLFGTLRGAQQGDAGDLIDLQVGGSGQNIRALWWPWGPPSGVRQANTLVATLTATGTAPTTMTALNMDINDPRFQSGSYLLKYRGASASQTGNYADLFASPDGVAPADYLSDGELLTYTAIEAETLVGIVGCSPDELCTMFALKEYNPKQFIGTIVTVAGQIVQIAAAVATVANISMNIVKSIRQGTGLQKLQRCDWNSPVNMRLRSSKRDACPRK